MGFITRLFKPKSHEELALPTAAYHMARAIYGSSRFFLLLARFETRYVVRRHPRTAVDRPVYITGLARAGTTITLEMLSQHPDVATHRYFHIPNPYVPYWWDRFLDRLSPTYTPPVERIHKDGILVDRNSPEALEEPLWRAFFTGLHDERRSNVLDGSVQNPRFERYYRDHLFKLLAAQGRSRYVAKSNYSVTRMEYLLRLFPDARFVIIVRDPVSHIASYLKQNGLFESIERRSRRTLRITQCIGHHEFGTRRVYINTGNTAETAEIRRLSSGGQAVEGAARYWAMIYDYVADRLEANAALRRAALVVRHEDLCAHAAQTLDRIMQHTGLSATAFAPVKAAYVTRLKPPRHDTHGFTAADLATIDTQTARTAARYRYRFDRPASLFVADAIDGRLFPA